MPELRDVLLAGGIVLIGLGVIAAVIVLIVVLVRRRAADDARSTGPQLAPTSPFALVPGPDDTRPLSSVTRSGADGGTSDVPDAFVAAPRPASEAAGASGMSAASGLSRVTGGSGVTGASGTPGSGASPGVGAGSSGVSDGTPSTSLAPTVVAGEAATDGRPAGDPGAAAPLDAAGRPAEPAWHEIVASADDAEPFLYTTGSYAAPAPLPNPWATSGPQPPVVAEPVRPPFDSGPAPTVPPTSAATGGASVSPPASDGSVSAAASGGSVSAPASDGSVPAPASGGSVSAAESAPASSPPDPIPTPLPPEPAPEPPAPLPPAPEPPSPAPPGPLEPPTVPPLPAPGPIPSPLPAPEPEPVMGSAAAGAAPVPPAAVDPAVAAPSAATEIPAGPGAPPDDERTILIAGRGADATPAWLLILDTGERIGLATESVVLGRKPGAVEYGVPGVAVPDPTKTVSKVHARLDRVGDHWSITDLGSTNGTSLVEPGGRERLLARGGSEVVRGRFLLGEVGLVLVRNPEAAR